MAVVDADYKFLYVDVGAEGGACDGGIWKACTLHAAIEARLVRMPLPEPIPNDDKFIPYNFIGDDAFAMKTRLIKPFSHHSQEVREMIFNQVSQSMTCG